MFLGELPPPPPRDCFGREKLIEEVVRLVENLEPIALIGAGGIGKTSIALTVLHHNRIKQRFGENRRFLRCDQFSASRAQFLARLSKVIGAGVENPEDLTPLRPSLSSKDTLIVLDNAESVIDPQGTDSREIYSIVDELCRFKKVCLLITSRITTVPPHCKRPEIPQLSMEAACDIFYGIYGSRGKSGVINDLLHRLDFHALSITLLATTASQNAWDYDRLEREWNAQRARVLQTNYNESLAITVELSVATPTFRSLDPNARDLLGVIAFFPQGIDEKNLDWLFPTISNRNTLFDTFCLLSLTYRSNGFVTMLAPIRDYLRPQDPRSSLLLCETKDHYFKRLSIGADPDNPGHGEGRWVMSEGVNIEYLLDVYTSIDPNSEDIWDACYHFMIHLYWHKPRQTILGSKIEALADDHPSKPKCLSQLAPLFGQVGHRTEQKRLIDRALGLERRRKDDTQFAATLRRLADVNRLLCFDKEGIKQAEEALKIFKRIGDTIGKAQCLNSLAALLLYDKQLDAAGNAASRAMGLVPKKGQEFLLCDILLTFGEINRSKGERKKALHHFEMALRIASPFEWHSMLYWIHSSLVRLFLGEGKLDEANANIERCKLHAADNPFRLGRTMFKQARVWYQQLRLEDAKLEALDALEIFEKLGDARIASCCRHFLQKVEGAMEKRSTRPRWVSRNNITPYVR
jgi:tetratricopeptide (TPR) repeat protein